MCGECRALSRAARKRACIPNTLDMPLKVTDKTDKTTSRRHGSVGEHSSDVLTKPTEGLSWFFAARVCPKRPRGAPVGLWVNERRQGVPAARLGRPVGPGWRFCAFGAKGRGVVARRLCVTQPAWVVDATCRPDTLDETEDMEV